MEGRRDGGRIEETRKREREEGRRTMEKTCTDRRENTRGIKRENGVSIYVEC